jgi:uncharacterized membrane protein YGL010W
MARLFRPVQDLLVSYAMYHRDKRNIATHLVGIPMIVLAIEVLLWRPLWITASGWHLAPVYLVLLLSGAWYLTRGSFVLGAAVVGLHTMLAAVAYTLAQGSTAQWLSWGLGLFVAGWVIQFIGHYYEGKKPAFVDDIVGLLIGPMFVVAEVLFAFGWGKPLLAAVTRAAGPTVIRQRGRSPT